MGGLALHSRCNAPLEPHHESPANGTMPSKGKGGGGYEVGLRGASDGGWYRGATSCRLPVTIAKTDGEMLNNACRMCPACASARSQAENSPGYRRNGYLERDSLPHTRCSWLEQRVVPQPSECPFPRHGTGHWWHIPSTTKGHARSSSHHRHASTSRARGRRDTHERGKACGKAPMKAQGARSARHTWMLDELHRGDVDQ